MIEREQLTGVVVSFKDITERHRSEAALQRSHRQLEATLAELKTTQQQVLQQERLRAMGQMASGIAHDFNNSLVAHRGLRRSAPAPARPRDRQGAGLLKLINTAARDAAAVVKRLRGASTASAASSPSDAAVDLNHVASRKPCADAAPLEGPGPARAS